jgi:hypothetical protein
VSRQGTGGKEFKVRVDVELPQETLDRIEKAIQRAVLSTLADVDVADGYSVVMRVPDVVSAEEVIGGGRPRDPIGGGGATEGIWIRDEQSLLG